MLVNTFGHLLLPLKTALKYNDGNPINDIQ